MKIFRSISLVTGELVFNVSGSTSAYINNNLSLSEMWDYTCISHYK